MNRHYELRCEDCDFKCTTINATTIDEAFEHELSTGNHWVQLVRTIE